MVFNRQREPKLNVRFVVPDSGGSPRPVYKRIDCGRRQWHSFSGGGLRYRFAQLENRDRRVISSCWPSGGRRVGA